MTFLESSVRIALTVALLSTPSFAQEPEGDERPDAPAPPQLVTDATRKDKAARSALEKPGRVLFEEDFESEEALEKFFEVRGRDDGRAVRSTDREVAHGGEGALRLTAPAADGRASGAGASGWLGVEGYERLYFRRYIRFAADYDQGNLNHVGGGLAGTSGRGKWDGMGKAGIRPTGEDRFTAGFEPWRGWKRYEAPGYMFVYAYWMEMVRDRDGNFWGNMLGPEEDERVVPERDRWVCLEHMIQVNDVGEANGELAAWIDGELYLHYTGIRWRSAEAVRIKRFNLGVYVHAATQDNTVWYDDVVVSTGYVGPEPRKKDR